MKDKEPKTPPAINRVNFGNGRTPAVLEAGITNTVPKLVEQMRLEVKLGTVYNGYGPGSCYPLEIDPHTARTLHVNTHPEEN